ncbi:MAG TPA: hypothetical protein VGH32_13020, partial [Pirellulales bacterium]
MADALKLLLVPVYGWAGWWLSQRFGDRARRWLRTVIGAAFILWIATVATGIGRNAEPGATTHRWLGHGLFIAVWLLAPAATGMLVQRSRRFAIWLALAVISVGATLLGALTGYLGPSHGDARSPETVMRFNVLHCTFLHVVVGVCLFAWIFVLRPKPIEFKRNV